MTVAFGIAGAVVGAQFGNPAMGWAIATSLAGFLFPPRLDPQERGKLDDLRVTGSGYGVMIPKSFGDNLLGGNIIWATSKVDHPRRRSSGGKGAPSQTVITHSYTFNVAVLFAEGEIDNIRRIWAEDLLIYEDGLTTYDIAIYLGTETQDIDPTIESVQGVGSSTAYRGTAYFVIANMNLDPWGGRTPSFRVEVAANEPAETIFLDTQNSPVAFLKPDGTLWAAGSNASGKFGLGPGAVGNTYTTPVQIASGVVAAGCGSDFIHYANEAGDVYFAGIAGSGQAGNGSLTSHDTWTLIRNFSSGVKQIFGGLYTAYVVTNDGKIFATGLTGGTYVFGNASTGNFTTFTEVKSSGVEAVHSEYITGVLLGEDGYLYYAGRQDRGQFGIGSTTEITTWTKHTALGTIKDICSSSTFDDDVVLVVKTDGTVWAAGKNTYGGFGHASLGTSYESHSFVQVPGVTGVVAVEMNDGGACFALDETGQVWSWGRQSTGCTGQGSIADGTLVDPAIIVTGCKNLAAINAGGLAIKTDDTVYGWGYGGSYNRGDNSTANVLTPVLMPWFTSSHSTVTVATILNALADDVALPEANRDFSDADGQVTGFVIGQRTGFKQSVETLLRCYATDLAEFDHKIRAIKRGGSIIATIDEDDLGAYVYGGAAPSTRVTLKDTSELELPGRIDITYFSKARAYQQASQSALRFAKGSILDPVTVGTSIVFTDDVARQTAEMLLYSEWIEREAYSFNLPYDYLFLAPSDPVYLPVNGELVRVRIVQMQIGIFGVVSFAAVRDDPSVLTQTALGGNTDRDDWVLSELEDTTLFAWNGNALKDAHTGDIGLYLAGTGGTGWPGAVVYISRDSGASYLTLESLTDAATAGYTSSSLGTFDTTGLFDEDNTLTVELIRGTLESVSEAEVIAGLNAARVGSEVIQFQTVTPIGGGVYELSRLLRGRRGTVIEAHSGGDPFVYLEPDAVKRVNLELALRGRTVRLKAPSVGQALVDVPSYDVEIVGYEFYPYSPVNVEGERDGSDNLTITWVRRARKDYEMADGGDIPLGEDTEAYEVDVMDGLTVVRTIDGLSSETASYSAADQTTDFGSAQSSLTVRVYQIGRYGRGYKAEATI